MKIYGNKTFNAVKVVLTAEEAGMPYEYININLQTGEHKTPDYMKIHPLGKIPAMEHNGHPIFESNTMCRYIANVSASNLYSKDPLEAAKIDQTVDFIGYHAGRWIAVYFFQEIVRKVFQNAEPDQAAINEAAGFLKEQLPYIDGLLAKDDFLCGGHITIADCIALAMFMTSEYTSFNFDQYKNIGRWYSQMKKRPSYAAMMKHFPVGYKFE
jgi:glutathione S-transferase